MHRELRAHPAQNNRPKHNRQRNKPLRRSPKTNPMRARRPRSLVHSIRTTAVRRVLSHASPRINPIATISAIRSKTARAAAAAVGGATNRAATSRATINANRAASVTHSHSNIATPPRNTAINRRAAPNRRYAMNRSPKSPFRSRRSSRSNPT